MSVPQAPAVLQREPSVLPPLVPRGPRGGLDWTKGPGTGTAAGRPLVADCLPESKLPQLRNARPPTAEVGRPHNGRPLDMSLEDCAGRGRGRGQTAEAAEAEAPDSRLLAVSRALSAGRYEEACCVCGNVLRDRPDSVAALYARGESYRLRGLHAAAVEDYGACLSLDGGSARAHRARGLSLIELRRFAQAAKDLQQVRPRRVPCVCVALRNSLSRWPPAGAHAAVAVRGRRGYGARAEGRGGARAGADGVRVQNWAWAVLRGAR